MGGRRLERGASRMARECLSRITKQLMAIAHATINNMSISAYNYRGISGETNVGVGVA